MSIDTAAGNVREEFKKATDKDITDYLLIEKTELCKADATIVLGNQHAYTPLVNQAAKLYYQGLSGHIVLAGGRRDMLGNIESEALFSRMIHDEDVPPAIMSMERQSANTPENLRYSRRLLEDERGIKLERVILVGSAVAGRRFLMTAAREWPDVVCMAANINPFLTPLADWHKHGDQRTIVKGEFAKIPLYLAWGHIQEIDPEAINRDVRNMRMKVGSSVLEEASP